MLNLKFKFKHSKSIQAFTLQFHINEWWKRGIFYFDLRMILKASHRKQEHHILQCSRVTNSHCLIISRGAHIYVINTTFFLSFCLNSHFASFRFVSINDALSILCRVLTLIGLEWQMATSTKRPSHFRVCDFICYVCF